MIDNILLGRSIKMDGAVRCDFCNRPIERGKYGLQIVGDPGTVRAQGMYHGRGCYEAALSHYDEVKNKVEEEKGE